MDLKTVFNSLAAIFISIGGAIQGFDNMVIFNNVKSAGLDALLGAIGGGVFGGAVGGVSSWWGGKTLGLVYPRLTEQEHSL